MGEGSQERLLQGQIPCKMDTCGAWETSQLVKRLLHTHEGLRVDPQQ